MKNDWIVCSKGCTAFDVHLPFDLQHHHRDKDSKEFVCTLYGHKDVESATAVPGDCYTIKMLDPSQVEKLKSQKKVNKPAPAPAQAKPKSGGKKEPKIPVFEQPKVLEDEDDVTDEGWLFEPPPPEVRSRKHIDTILHLVMTSFWNENDYIFVWNLVKDNHKDPSTH